jgi:carboxymethylenebutenolidase
MSRKLRLFSLTATFAATLLAGDCLAAQQMSTSVNGQQRIYLLERPDASGTPASPAQEEVTFQSNGYTLYGCITRPEGTGPLPAVIYNHGSEKNPGRCGPAELARAYVEHGYAFFSFQRRGHGQSQGDYIGDLQKKIVAEMQNPNAREPRIVALQDDYNRDVVSAVEWLMNRPDIDRHHVAMTGISFGGIQTLLTAEKVLGLRAFIAFAPGAMSWRNQALHKRLEQAVRGAKAPIFLAQAQNDFSLGPSELLGPIVRAKGAPNDAKIYPAFGNTPQQGHGGFAVRGGIPIWSADVFAFLDKVMKGNEVAAPR